MRSFARSLDLSSFVGIDAERYESKQFLENGESQPIFYGEYSV